MRETLRFSRASAKTNQQCTVSREKSGNHTRNGAFLVCFGGITREMLRFSFALAESHEKWCVSRLLWRNHTRKGAFLVCFGGITREMLRFSCFLRGHHQIARKRAHTAGVARARRDLPQKIFFHA